MDDLATDNPNAQVTDNPAEPVIENNGTGASSGQATEATPTDDLFKGVDPRKLPPEVKTHYDSMLRDYREKTAKISETTKAEVEKATQAYRDKATAYDQIATQEEFVKQWNEYVQKSQSQTQEQNASDPELKQMKTQLEEMNQKMQLSEMSQVTEAFAEAVNEKGVKLHPEFDQLNTLSVGQLQNGEDFSLLRACVELAQGSNPQERLANGYKNARSTYNSIFEAGKKAGLGRVQAKVQNGSQAPTNSSGEMLSVTEKKPKSAREALEMARKGMVVSRD